MTEKEIITQLLRLFSIDWNDPAQHQGFRELRKLVPGQGQWISIIDSRLMALEKKTEESILLLRKTLSCEPSNYYASLLLASILCHNNNQPEEAINIYDSLLHQGFHDQALRDWIEVLTLSNKAYALALLKKIEGVSCVSDELVKRFSDSQDILILRQVARTLYNKGVALGKIGKSEEEIRVYEELIEQLGKSEELNIRELVANAMVNKGLALEEMGKNGDVIQVFDGLIEQFGKSEELPLREQVANALVNKGVTLEQMGKNEDAIQVFDGLIEQFGKSEEPNIREQVARALRNKGVALGEMGKNEDAIQVFDGLIEQFGKSEELNIRELVARALVNKGFTLEKMGKNEDAIRVFDGLIEQFGKSEEPNIREEVVIALRNKGSILKKMGKNKDAIRVFDGLIEQFGKSEEPNIREQVAKALRNKGLAHGEMGEPKEEIRVYDGLIEQFGKSKELPLREQVAKALVNKGVTLGQMGKNEDAIRVYDGLVEQFGKSEELPLHEQVATAIVNKGITLGKMGKNEDAIRVYDGLVEQFGKSEELPLHELMATAIVNKGITLGKMGKPKEEIRAYDEVIEQFGKSEELNIRELVAKALLYKAECLLDNDCVVEARALLTKAENEYIGNEELKTKLTSYYAYLYSRFVSIGEPEEEDQDKERSKTALDITRKTLMPNLMVYLTEVLKHVDRSKKEEYFTKMSQAKDTTDIFIKAESQFSPDFSFLLILREWNSYTPVIPGEEESDRGGGYFLRHAGEGIVIDPGYDFIENFYRAGGRLCDIDHLIVTHAHDDHTAELEALLMLLQRRWNNKDLPNKKRVSLYLSLGVQRKFAGLLNLRDPKYKHVVTLCPAEKGFEQQIRLNSETKLTVLPAYHDDVITHDSAVGLGFEFATKSNTRRVVFTSDSGLYPLKIGENGKKRLYDDDEETPMLDVAEGKALYERYPERFRKPDLLVAHIGSIKENEFSPIEAMRDHAKTKDVGTTLITSDSWGP